MDCAVPAVMATDVVVDYSRDSLLTDFGIETLRDRYLIPGEVSPQDAFARAAKAFSDDAAMAQRIYDYASKLWFMYATPILSNGGTKRGFPISCFLGTVGDSREGIISHYEENAWLSSIGGGTSGDWSQVRSNDMPTKYGSKSSGIIPFIHAQDGMVLAFSQGTTRRGSYAAYLDISHPEIEEFITICKSSGGDINRKAPNSHNAVNITDDFMEIIEKCLRDPYANDAWPLVDPHSKEVRKVVSAKKLWESIMETRMATGEPFIVFIDTANRGLPKALRDKGLRIRQSNLCTEIMLPTDVDRTAVCCLSSVNFETYDDWKDHPQFISDLVRFLDNVLTYFIANAPKALGRTVKSAAKERSIGIGAMGFHSYLQMKGIPFEGALASSINRKMFRGIKEKALEETKRLAVERGEPEDLAGSGVRNAHLLAIAPNASSSIVCGNTSPSIEPFRANAFTQKTLSGTSLMKNRHLETVLESLGYNTTEVWKSIVENRGSVRHLDFLDDYTKDVFKTSIEIDQEWIIDHAASRQEYICQAQSVNLFFAGNAHKLEVTTAHFLAWKKGLKSLYYCRSEAINRAEVAKSIDGKTCLSCEG